MKEQGTIRLADRILSGETPIVVDGLEDSKYANGAVELLKQVLLSAPVVIADDCATLVFRDGNSIKPSDWNSLITMPPFRSVWIEMRLPVPKAAYADRAGVWVSIVGREDLLELGAIQKDSGTVWKVNAVSVFQYRDPEGRFPKSLHYMGVASFEIDIEGRIVSEIRGRSHHRDWVAGFAGVDEISEDDAQKCEDQMMITVFTALFAISLMHCKNVKTRSHEPPAKLSHAFQKRHGRPLVRFHTLEIEPMKQVLETEGGISHNGLKKALHICRGHFAHYTDEKPLFGRVTGTFWKPAHVRGSLSEGAVVKDYKVNPPAGASV